MHKSIKRLACAATVAALTAGVQISALAAVSGTSSHIDTASSHVSSQNAASSHYASSLADLNRTEHASSGLAASGQASDGASALRREGSGVADEIQPYGNDIPNTGAESLVIPGAVALLAAATAAVTLAGKKK